MNVSEVAELLGVHVNTIYNYINNGKVKAIKVGGAWQITEEEFLRLKREQSRTPRMVIDSLTLTIETVEKDIRFYEEMLAKWRGEISIGHLDMHKELSTTTKQLKRMRSDYYTLIEGGYLFMDEQINYDLNTNEKIEYRNNDDSDE